MASIIERGGRWRAFVARLALYARTFSTTEAAELGHPRSKAKPNS